MSELLDGDEEGRDGGLLFSWNDPTAAMVNEDDEDVFIPEFIEVIRQRLANARHILRYYGHLSS